MSDDRTQHVIDAIDGALDDYAVSGDAMRWTAEPKPTAPLAGEFRAAAALNVNLHDFAESLGEALRAFYDAAEGAIRAWAEASRPRPRTPEGERLAELVCRAFDVPRSVVDPSPAELARARALHLHRNRNTGPARPAAGQAKRPRRLA